MKKIGYLVVLFLLCFTIITNPVVATEVEETSYSIEELSQLLNKRQDYLKRVMELSNLDEGASLDEIRTALESYESRYDLYMRLGYVLGKEGQNTLYGYIDLADLKLVDGVPLYLQTDPKWKEFPYYFHDKTTYTPIKESGCVPTSFAMVTTALLNGTEEIINAERKIHAALANPKFPGRKYQVHADSKIDGVITPDEMVIAFSELKQHYDGGSSWTSLSLTNSTYLSNALNIESVSIDVNKMIEKLKAGSLLLLSTGIEGRTCYFTSKGHGIAIAGLRVVNGEVYFVVKDPNRTYNYSARWSKIKNGDYIAPSSSTGEDLFRASIFTGAGPGAVKGAYAVSSKVERNNQIADQGNVIYGAGSAMNINGTSHKLIFPVNDTSFSVSTIFGWKSGKFHNGMDFTSPKIQQGGASMLAVLDGTVEYVKTDNSGEEGRYVVINHGKNAQGKEIRTRYLHMAGVSVQKGDTVKQGEVLGKIGGSGLGSETTYTIHAHLDIQTGSASEANAKTNPIQFLFSTSDLGKINQEQRATAKWQLENTITSYYTE